MSTRMNYAIFCQFRQEQEPFTHVLCISALIYRSDLKNQPVHVLFRNDATIFRGGRSFAIDVVVTPRSSSGESTISVRRRGERNVCFTVTVDRVH